MTPDLRQIDGLINHVLAGLVEGENVHLAALVLIPPKPSDLGEG